MLSEMYWFVMIFFLHFLDRWNECFKLKLYSFSNEKTPRPTLLSGAEQYVPTSKLVVATETVVYVKDMRELTGFCIPNCAFSFEKEYSSF